MSIVQQCGIFGNTFCFEDLYRWIENSTNNISNKKATDQSSCVILIGPPGVGKSYGVERMCDQLGISIKRIDSTNCHSTKDMCDLLTKMASTNLEDSLLEKETKRIIFIDEFEVLVGLDRNMPSILYQHLDCSNAKTRTKPMPYIPVVVACNTNIEKKLGDLRRGCRCICLRNPDDADVMLMLRWHAQAIGMDAPSDLILSISEIVQGNMQQAVRILAYELVRISQNIKTTCKHATIDRMPDIDVLYTSPNRSTARMIFEEDMWMNPLRFHENLPAEIETRRGTRAKKATVYSEILRCLIEWDVMSTSIEDGCTEISTEHLCRAPYLLEQLKRRKDGNQTSMVHFTKTLSQMSLQKKMEKQSYNDDFPWKHIGNYHYTLKKHNPTRKKFS